MEKKNHMISSAKKAFEKHLTPIFDLKKKTLRKIEIKCTFFNLIKTFLMFLHGNPFYKSLHLHLSKICWYLIS